ncbi:SIMPL domain-containing protein [Egibacter rhizosphaerae]|nr:SIMPL domain-containing protein [Egibacter rhizosphaerae]
MRARQRMATVVAGALLLAGCDDDPTDEPVGDEASDAAGVGGGGADVAIATDAGVAEHDEGLRVAGEGRVQGEPDVLSATIGVEHTAHAVQPALDAANADLEAVREALVDAGVDPDDLATADVDVSQTREEVPPEEREDGAEPAEVYQVRNLLEVRVRDMDTAGEVLDAGVAAAGDAARVRNVAFDLEDNAELVAQAREAAVADARDRADQYAQAAGAELGALVELTEVGAARPAPADASPADVEADDAEAAGVPVEPGEEEVGVTIRTRWELVDE